MPTSGWDSRGFHSAPDYRDLLNRLGFGRIGNVVSFSPDECWVLWEHIHWLQTQAEAAAEPRLGRFAG